MNMATLPILILHDLHQGNTNELKEHKQHFAQLNIHIEQEHTVLRKQLNQDIKDKDQEELHQQILKDVFEATCREVSDMDVCEEESVEDKVVKLGLVVKESKKKITNV